MKYHDPNDPDPDSFKSNLVKEEKITTIGVEQQVPLAYGVRVRLIQMSAQQPDLNNTLGTVWAYDKDTDRWKVKFDDLI